ncbi:NAD(+) diphosphatase [Bertholletia excelsa]
MDQVFAENGGQHVELLPAVDDDHDGVIVEMEEPMDSETFHSLLKASMLQWKLQGKKGIWIKVPIRLVNLVEAAVKEGFRFHHAEPLYLMLVYWIPKTGDTIPANASHQVRIGAIVVNDKRELLVVQEKNGKFRGTGVWKIPTGVLEEGEDIFAAAEREVKEETGIDTKFVEVLAFRQVHKSLFEKSELFFLCMLHPLSFDITVQELEIDAAQWMPFGEYTAQVFPQDDDHFRKISEICLAKFDRDYVGFSRLPVASIFDDQESYLYLNGHQMNH